MKNLFIGLLLLASTASFAQVQTLPMYDEANLIQDSRQKEIILEAIRLDLSVKGIDKCLTKNNRYGSQGWNLHEYYLKAGNVDLYLFEGDQPIIVLRNKDKIGNIMVDILDFNIYTNSDNTAISSMILVEYRVIHTRVNRGTLTNPDFENTEVVKKVGETDCLNP